MRPVLAAVLFVGGLAALVIGARWWTEPDSEQASSPPRNMLTIGDWDTGMLVVVSYRFDIGVSPAPLMRVSEDQFRELSKDILFDRPMQEYLRCAMFCDITTGEVFRPSGMWCWSERCGYSDREWGDEKIIEVLRE